MKIAFYLDDIKNGIDYSCPDSANPGIGGTQFLIWELSYYMTKYSNNEVVLFAPQYANFNEDMNTIVMPNIIECVLYCKENFIDYLIIRGPSVSKKIIEIAEKENVKLIVWSHNFEAYTNIYCTLKSDSVKRNICVSNEQLDLLLDTDIYYKSRYIHNGISFKDFDNIKVKKVNNRIVYIGNLYPNSGYKQMAKAWTKIKKQIPDAELFIIGGNNLYNTSVFKSEYSKTTQRRLNKVIKKHLYDGKVPKKDVYFKGVLGGKEKLEVMASASVGVGNITDAGETFGLSVVEFEALGIPVVSVNYRGVRETVINKKTGILVKKANKISDAIVYLLKHNEVMRSYGKNAKLFVRKNFDIINIVSDWDKMLNNIEKCEIIKENKSRFGYDGKRIIYCNYKIRKFLKFIPPISFYKYLRYGFFRILSKLNII